MADCRDNLAVVAVVVAAVALVLVLVVVGFVVAVAAVALTAGIVAVVAVVVQQMITVAECKQSLQASAVLRLRQKQKLRSVKKGQLATGLSFRSEGETQR